MVPMVMAVTRRILTLLACSVAVLAAACGSSNSTSASIPAPQAVEKSTAIAAGDSVCQAMLADQQRIIGDFKAAHPQATLDDVRDFLVNTLVPRMEQGIGDFHRVGQPTKDRPAWNAIVTHLDTDLLYFKAMIRDDPIALLTINPFDREAARFTDYGFKVCGQPAT
jgi:hypothetical protein